MKSINICIVGATGLVGRTFIDILEKSDIFIDNIRFIASKKSLGKDLVFRNKKYYIEELNEEVFENIDFALFFVDSHLASKWCKIASEKVKYVLDNSSFFRLDNNCSLIVPEINFNSHINKSNIISNPNCSTIQCLLPLYAISKKYKIRRIVYNTYQSVSGSGQKGIDEYIRCKNGGCNQFYLYNIMNTCIPKIGNVIENLYTEEEMKMIYETRRVLNDNNISITATCVRVPILYGHGVSVVVELDKECDIAEIKKLLQNQEGIVMNSIPNTEDICNNDLIYVGRLRKDLFNHNSLLFYVTGNNLRRGAAYNTYKILEKLIDLYI